MLNTSTPMTVANFNGSFNDNANLFSSVCLDALDIDAGGFNQTCNFDGDSRDIYWQLLNIGEKKRSLSSADVGFQSSNKLVSLSQRSRRYLDDALAAAAQMAADIPSTPMQLESWINENTVQVGKEYQSYLAARKDGAPRSYFSNKSHALYFINAVAPTKLVDGAWLYGLLSHWKNPHMAPLIEIYLEELGCGVANKNHVLLYKRLLAENGCSDFADLPAQNFVQGALQLALAQHGDDFFPEVLGFNLGYEQLPLHLLITAYELNELGIDPYYFTLHTTIDNVHSGHAKKALQGVLEFIPRVDNPDEFYRRVVAGYKLNLLGAGATDIIATFDLEQELLTMLEQKSKVGKYMHSDRCRFGGRTVSEWLRTPEQIANFLDALIKAGWIKRNQDPQESRFWHLLEGDKPAMFGVFSPAQQQLIYDWIAGDFSPQGKRNNVIRRLGGESTNANYESEIPSADFNGDGAHLRQQLEALNDKDARMKHLLPLLAPAQHHTPAGLMATQLFARHFGLS